MTTFTLPAPLASSVNYAKLVACMKDTTVGNDNVPTADMAVVAPHQPAGTGTPLRGRISP